MLRRLVVLTVASACLAVGVPLTAHAATLNLVDARGDVYRETNAGYRPAPAQRRIDITRTRIRHTDRALVVRTSVLELRREGRAVGMAMRMRTSKGLYREMDLTAGPIAGSWRGQVTLTRRNGSVAPCRTAHRVDYAADRMVVRIPRSCLGNPRGVQTTVVSVFLGGGRFFIDNPHNDRARINVWTRYIRRG
jgi:hypothetical protein